MIYAFYHASAETVGLMAPILKKLKLPYEEIRPYRGEAVPKNSSNLNGLIVMGGPMNVDETKKFPFLVQEVKLIQDVIKDGKPVLGICLGSQIIAKSLGSRVYQNKSREVGWHPLELTMEAILDPVFKSFPNGTKVLHWHGDTFDLPEGAVHLAGTEKCQNQAFRWGKNVYALQFHLEVTPEMAKDWVSADEDYVRGAGEDPEEIIEQTPEAFSVLEPIATKLFKSLLSDFSH